MNISVIGLGKLGVCTAASFAGAGHRVAGYDTDPRVVAALRAGRAPVEETDLEAALAAAGGNFRLARDYQDAVESSEITLIIVPTPSRADGRFSNDHVVRVLEQLSGPLRAKRGFHVVDVVSTVMPGSCDGVFRPLLEERTGKLCGRDFGLVYNPEFIAIGSVIRDFLHADMVLIGASDPASGEKVRRLYAETCRSRPTFALMSLVNAEIAKISLNCYVTMKISYANALAEVCEAVPGADIDAVTTAIGADSRVGRKYLKGGLGFGGPCFPRDNLAYQAFAAEHGRASALSEAVVQVNGRAARRLGEMVEAHLGGMPGQVAILGVSYKPHTHLVEESPAIELARWLLTRGHGLAIHDPRALGSAREALGPAVSYHEDPYAAVAGARAVVLMTEWPAYRELDWERVGSLAEPGALLLDTWRIARGKTGGRLRYRGIGLGAPRT